MLVLSVNRVAIDYVVWVGRLESAIWSFRSVSPWSEGQISALKHDTIKTLT